MNSYKYLLDDILNVCGFFAVPGLTRQSGRREFDNAPSRFEMHPRRCCKHSV